MVASETRQVVCVRGAKTQQGQLVLFEPPLALQQQAAKALVLIEEAEAAKVVPYGVSYMPALCPRCHTEQVRCYCSRKDVRYYRCKVCELRNNKTQKIFLK